MANMSYCRFENTLDDLQDCFDHLHEELSESENRCRKALVELCRSIVEQADEANLDELIDDEL